MPEPTETDIGARLREIRESRALTERELATAAGVSASLIGKLEQGEITDIRMETARKIAIALRVHTSSLMRRNAGRADDCTVDRWADVRAALSAPPPPPLDDEPTPRGVAASLRDARALRDQGHFTTLATVLPPLLRDADALTGTGARTRQTRGQVLQLAAWMLTQTHQYDAAELAIDRALADASDRLEGAAAINSRCWLLLRQGRLRQTQEIAGQWADDLEPRMSRATAEELAAWGWMLMRFSTAAARDGRTSEADDALRLAKAAAVALGRDIASKVDYPRLFGPVKVARQQVEHAAVLDQPDRVLTLATKMKLTSVPVTNKNRRVLLDVASAYAKTREEGQAVGILHKVLAASPEWLSHQRYARDILSDVIDKRRTLSPEMRTIADAVKLPL